MLGLEGRQQRAGPGVLDDAHRGNAIGAAPPRCRTGAVLNGFKNFIARGNVIDLAVAVVIGAAFGALVTALVTDLLTPVIAAIIGKTDFSDLTFTINGSKFLYGSFLNALIAFFAIAVGHLLLRGLAAGDHREAPQGA